MKKENPGKCIFITHLLYLLKVPGGGGSFQNGHLQFLFYIYVDSRVDNACTEKSRMEIQSLMQVTS